MEWFNAALGIGVEAKDLTFVQIALRAIIVFVSALAMVRLSDRRFLAKMSAVDAILGFILASMLARAVNGTASFFPTLGGGFLLVFLHKACMAIAFRSDKFGRLIKGSEDLLIENGQVQEQGMRANHITHRDLLEELRLNGPVSSPEEVKLAFVERSGTVSVVPLKAK